MASVNKVTLLGNCGRDPEVRYLASGMAVASVTIATSTKRKDKASGEYVEETQWHRVQAFDKLAEVFGQYVKKGSSIYVEGRLKYGKYTDKDGVEKQTTDIIVTEMQMLGGKPSGESSAPSQKPAPKPSGSRFDDMPDDMPPFDLWGKADAVMGLRASRAM